MLAWQHYLNCVYSLKCTFAMFDISFAFHQCLLFALLMHCQSLGCLGFDRLSLKEHSTFFLKIGSFYISPRVKQLSFTVFESIQLISGSGALLA